MEIGILNHLVCRIYCSLYKYYCILFCKSLENSHASHFILRDWLCEIRRGRRAGACLTIVICVRLVGSPSSLSLVHIQYLALGNLCLKYWPCLVRNGAFLWFIQETSLWLTHEFAYINRSQILIRGGTLELLKKLQWRQVHEVMLKVFRNLKPLPSSHPYH